MYSCFDDGIKFKKICNNTLLNNSVIYSQIDTLLQYIIDDQMEVQTNWKVDDTHLLICTINYIRSTNLAKVYKCINDI